MTSSFMFFQGYQQNTVRSGGVTPAPGPSAPAPSANALPESTADTSYRPNMSRMRTEREPQKRHPICFLMMNKLGYATACTLPRTAKRSTAPPECVRFDHLLCWGTIRGAYDGIFRIFQSLRNQTKYTIAFKYPNKLGGTHHCRLQITTDKNKKRE